MAANGKRGPLTCGGVEAGQNLAVLNGIDQAQPEHLEWDAERQIVH
jgi:hypothetical protein